MPRPGPRRTAVALRLGDDVRARVEARAQGDGVTLSERIRRDIDETDARLAVAELVRPVAGGAPVWTAMVERLCSGCDEVHTLAAAYRPDAFLGQRETCWCPRRREVVTGYVVPTPGG